MTCAACGGEYERPDMAGCVFHSGAICSLCCSLEKNCHDVCKATEAATDLPMAGIAD